MSTLGIIGGSGLDAYEGLEISARRTVETPYGSPSSQLIHGQLNGQSVVFLPRHGEGHQFPPHRINYRANIWALRESGVDQVIAVAAVGGVTADFGPGSLCIPDQLVDYTWGRAHTFFDGEGMPVEHIDFTQPYCGTLRDRLLGSARRLGIPAQPQGCYAATQGPRLETAAEVRRLEQDGCDLVGMTGMPEASLAKELGLCYACCALVVNWAAGKAEGPILMQEIEGNLEQGMSLVRQVIAELASQSRQPGRT